MAQRRALVIAAADDVGSQRVSRGLLDRGHAVVHSSLAALSLAGWQHVPEAGGGTTIALADGQVLRDADIAVVLNRDTGVALPRFASSPAADRDYASAEFSALLASWLARLARQGALVAHPPGADSQFAVFLHPLGWHQLAIRCQLSTGDFVMASSLRGRSAKGLERIGQSGFPQGSNIAGWYRSTFPSARRREVWVFGDACADFDEASMKRRCVDFVAALGLHYALLIFAESGQASRLIEVSALPPLASAEVVGRCVDWLDAPLRKANCASRS